MIVDEGIAMITWILASLLFLSIFIVLCILLTKRKCSTKAKHDDQVNTEPVLLYVNAGFASYENTQNLHEYTSDIGPPSSNIRNLRQGSRVSNRAEPIYSYASTTMLKFPWDRASSDNSTDRSRYADVKTVVKKSSVCSSEDTYGAIQISDKPSEVYSDAESGLATPSPLATISGSVEKETRISNRNIDHYEEMNFGWENNPAYIKSKLETKATLNNKVTNRANTYIEIHDDDQENHLSNKSNTISVKTATHVDSKLKKRMTSPDSEMSTNNNEVYNECPSVNVEGIKVGFRSLPRQRVTYENVEWVNKEEDQHLSMQSEANINSTDIKVPNCDEGAASSCQNEKGNGDINQITDEQDVDDTLSVKNNRSVMYIDINADGKMNFRPSSTHA